MFVNLSSCLDGLVSSSGGFLVALVFLAAVFHRSNDISKLVCMAWLLLSQLNENSGLALLPEFVRHIQSELVKVGGAIMVLLADTFRDKNSRVEKTLLVVDLTDSTRMKEDQGEAGWLTTYGWFYDMARDAIGNHNGKIVKFLGDGVLAAFDADRAVDAINCAIVMQEEMAMARAENRVRCSCTVGISTGELVQFDNGVGELDYIGTVADRAFRLCGAANANAVFVDRDTVAAASMTKVCSKAGISLAPKRKAPDYSGPEESLKLKGFFSPVPYHEILWENSRFSVKPPYASELSAARGIRHELVHAPAVSVPARRPAERPVWLKGRVSAVLTKYGFVDGPDAESFWFNSDYYFDAKAAVSSGQDVWFIPLDPLPSGKNRRASAIIPFGSSMTGILTRVSPDGYGFGDFISQHGETYSLFINLGMADSWTVGTRITVDLGENSKGPAGNWPRRSD